MGSTVLGVLLWRVGKPRAKLREETWKQCVLQVGRLLTTLGLRPRGAVSEVQVQGKGVSLCLGWRSAKLVRKDGALEKMLPSCEHKVRSALLARRAGPMASHLPPALCLSWVHMGDQRAHEGSISKWKLPGLGD